MNRPSCILLGSKPGSVVVLRLMADRGWDIRAVVVSPKFHRSWLPRPTLEETAKLLGIPVFTSQHDLPAELEADFILSYMFRYRVNEATRSRATRAALNFHAGALPQFGGWAYYNVAILEDATTYGCTCHYMDESFDSGPILRVHHFPITASQETAVSLERRAQSEMVRLFEDFCDIAESGRDLPVEEQDTRLRRYMTRDDFELLKEIPQDASAEEVDRRARAFWYPPFDGAYVRCGDVKVTVVPKCVQEELAQLLHAQDLDDLEHVARECRSTR